MGNGLGRLCASAVFAVVTAMIVSGCGCSCDFEEWMDGPEPWENWGDCEENDDCFEGCACINGECIETGWCFDDGDCAAGECDVARNTCMPGGPGGGSGGACDDTLCPEGCWFDSIAAICVETAFCANDADCMAGEVCQSDRATCVPDERVCGTPAPVPGQCEDDLCPEGCYWDPVGGGCVETAFCSSSGDPACFSDEYCDVERATCVPDERVCSVPKPGPTPPACTLSTDCPAGAECVEGVCAIPAPTPGDDPTSPDACTFNHECGSDGTCIDGDCHANCTGDADCWIGQICGNNGVCETDPAPTPECTTSAECGGGATYCINATCFPGCAEDSECGVGERCKRDVCRPENRTTPQCLLNSECGAGEECIDSVCRLRCWGDGDCAPLGAVSYCDVAWCVFPYEVTSDCNPTTPCADGSSCVNGNCGG